MIDGREGQGTTNIVKIKLCTIIEVIDSRGVDTRHKPHTFSQIAFSWIYREPLAPYYK